MNYTYNCLSSISPVGLKHLPATYTAVEDVKMADAILVRSTKMEGLDVSPNLLSVARAGAGVNNIPHADYAKKGIVVFNTPGANANAVKELVIAMLLLAARDLKGGIDWVQANASDPDIGKNAEKAKKAFAGTEIMGKTLGVVGLGAIGRLVANVAVDLGMNVIGYDPYLSVDAAWALNPLIRHVTDVNDLYHDSDYITLHLPAVATTKGMIDAEAIAAMKKGVVLVNAARDLIINEADVLAALDRGDIARYVADFATPGVAAHKGCLVMPHLGASTEEAEDNCAVMAVNETRDYLENGNIRNSVNYPSVTLGLPRLPGRVLVLHGNAAETCGAVTAALTEKGLDVASTATATHGAMGATLVDVCAPVSAEAAEALKAIPGVIRVRVIK